MVSPLHGARCGDALRALLSTNRDRNAARQRVLVVCAAGCPDSRPGAPAPFSVMRPGRITGVQPGHARNRTAASSRWRLFIPRVAGREPIRSGVDARDADRCRLHGLNRSRTGGELGGGFGNESVDVHASPRCHPDERGPAHLARGVCGVACRRAGSRFGGGARVAGSARRATSRVVLPGGDPRVLASPELAVLERRASDLPDDSVHASTDGRLSGLSAPSLGRARLGAPAIFSAQSSRRWIRAT